MSSHHYGKFDPCLVPGAVHVESSGRQLQTIRSNLLNIFNTTRVFQNVSSSSLLGQNSAIANYTADLIRLGNLLSAVYILS